MDDERSRLKARLKGWFASDHIHFSDETWEEAMATMPTTNTGKAEAEALLKRAHERAARENRDWAEIALEELQAVARETNPPKT